MAMNPQLSFFHSVPYLPEEVKMGSLDFVKRRLVGPNIQQPVPVPPIVAGEVVDTQVMV